MIKRQFISSSLIYTIVGALPLASGLLLLPFYANWLTSGQFGLLALYIAITMFMQILFNFGFDNYIGISYIDYKNEPGIQTEIIGTIFYSLLIIGAFILTLSLLVGEPLLNFFNTTGSNQTQLLFFPYGFMSVLTAFFNSMFKTYTSLLIYQQRPGKYMFMNIFNFVLTLTISIIWISYEKYSLNGPMWGRLLSGAGIFLLAVFSFNHEFKLRFSKQHISLFRKFCAYLLVYQLLFWMLSYLDRFVIGHSLSPMDLAVFDFALKCLLVIEFLQNGLAAAILPVIFQHWNDPQANPDSTDVKKYLNGLSAVVTLSIPAICILLPLVVPLFISNSAYYESFRFLPLLGLGYMLTNLRQIYSFPLIAKKRSDLLTRAFAASAVIQLIITVAGVKYLGLWGAVWAFLLTKPFHILFMYLQSRKVLTIKLSVKKQYMVPLIISVTTLLAMVIAGLENYFLLLLVFQISSVIVVGVFYRNEIRLLLESAGKSFLKKRL